jgi:2-desacetyl-2-hydroxyethyl bacteriochlorophyllide A dehydrogenase
MVEPRKVAMVLTAPRQIGYLDESIEDRPLAPHEVKVRTLYSGISAGTELTYYRASNPYLSKQWDSNKRLFIPNETEQGSVVYPVRNWGYEEVGEIIERGYGTEDLPLGALIYGNWGHRTTAVVTADFARERLLPDEVAPIHGIFSHIGAITMNGILDSAIRLGETVAIFGLGVVGNLMGQLAKLSGARVIGVDLLPQRLEKATEAGFDTVIDSKAGGVAGQIKNLTDGRGADVCIEASGAIPALNEAIRACAYSSKVVALGFYQGGAQNLWLGDEFHHNRISLICSQISGVNPELQHRWNRTRLVQTFMNLIAQKRLNMSLLITHTRSFWEAQMLYDLIDKQPNEVLQAVLDFSADPPDGLEIVRG